MEQEHSPYVMKTCVVAWLEYIRRSDYEIRELEQRIADIRTRLEGLELSPNVIRKHSTSDVMAEGVAKILELEEEWGDRVSERQVEIAAAKDLCSPDNLGRYAMWLHVVERRTWAEVGRKIGYGRSQTLRIANGSIGDLYLLIPEEFRRYTFPNAAPL